MCFCLLCRDYEKLNYCQLLATYNEAGGSQTKTKNYEN